MLSTNLKYPAKSHRKQILLPEESIDLAEFIGIVLGDGGINNPWQLVISLNSQKDSDYAIYIENLITNLFALRVVIRKRPKQNTLIVICTSSNLVDFLVSKGAVRGNKIAQKINIPLWISKDSDFKKAFVRGLVDTDGCLYLHKHTIKGKTYINLGFCFTSFSEKLLFSVADILSEFGIYPHITSNNQRIYLYNLSDVIKYLHVFGSSNPRIYSVYKAWRDSRVV